MRIAIPLFGDWISPRFGFSPEVWILATENGKVISQEKISMAGLTLSQWFNRLSSLGVDRVICGGIDGFCYRQLENIGIAVIPEIVGKANEVLNLFLHGKLKPGFRVGKGRNPRRRKDRSFGPLEAK